MKITRTDECPCTTEFRDLKAGDMFQRDDEDVADIYYIVTKPNTRNTIIATACDVVNVTRNNRIPKRPPSYTPVIKLCAELTVAEDKS